MASTARHSRDVPVGHEVLLGNELLTAAEAECDSGIPAPVAGLMRLPDSKIPVGPGTVPNNVTAPAPGRS